MGGTTDHTDNREEDRALGLLDYCRIVWQRKWLIIALCVVSAVGAYVYAVRLPKVYVSTATALMPREDIGFGGSRISLPGLPSGGGGTGGAEGSWGYLAPSLGISLSAQSPSKELYLAYLNSRTMREEIVEYFKQSWGPSVVSLIGGVSADVGKDSILRVTAESREPRLSAELANYYLKHLEEMLARKSKRIRELQKKFYLSRLEPARQDLEGAQNALIAFQEKYRVLGLSAADRASIAASAGGATSVIALEMQRTLKRMYLTDQNPEMIALDRQIYEAKKLISHSLWGEAQDLPPESPKAPPRKEYFVAATKMTPLQFKAADVLRTLQIRQGVYQMIATNVETTKYTDDAPPPQVEVLDPALPSGGPSKPNVYSYVRSAGLGSLVLGIFLALFLEYIQRVRIQERVRVAEPPWREPRFVPAVELGGDGPVSAEVFGVRMSESYPPEEPPSHIRERRRSSVGPVPSAPEGRRFL